MYVKKTAAFDLELLINFLTDAKEHRESQSRIRLGHTHTRQANTDGIVHVHSDTTALRDA